MEKYIEAPREVVFDAALDLHSAAENIGAITKMEVLTDGPIGLGTRFRETRVMFRKEATELMEITVFERPARFVYRQVLYPFRRRLFRRPLHGRGPT